MNRKYCETPSVGIWWFYNNDILLADAVETEKGQTYGDCITSFTAHTDFWDTALKNGKLEHLPSAAFTEYFAIPRGRVVFHKETGRYTVLHGGLKQRQLNKIRDFFCLPEELTDFDTDFHYKINPYIEGL